MKNGRVKKLAVNAYRKGTDYQFNTSELLLGPWTSYSLINDPKHMCFVLSRYKFCAKILESKKTIMEVGVGDGFGLPIIAQSAKKVYAVDWDNRLLKGNRRRFKHLKNVEYLHVDLNKYSPDVCVEGALLIDVIEHLDPNKEKRFLDNIISCIDKKGVLVVGTPNITASKYGTPRSKVQHINLKSMQTLRKTMNEYFENVFMFGMNDEVIHTGYAPMCHYIWAVGAGVRSKITKNK